MKYSPISLLCLCGLSLFTLLAGCTADHSPVVQSATPRPELQPIEPATRLRHPVALASIENDRVLLVANRRSGSIRAVDADRRVVVGEWEVGRELADMAVSPDQQNVVVVDEAANEVITLRWTGDRLESLARRVAIDPAPVSIVLSDDGRHGFVSSTWAQRITLLDLKQPAAPAVMATIDLPFAPGEMCLLPDGKQLAVAAAFGGRFCLIDLESREITVSREWNAHNLSGIALAANKKELLIPHQALMGDSPTTANGVHWGQVLMNLVRTVPIETLYAKSPPLGAFLDYLGTMDEAAGDPTAILVTHDDRRIVAYAGTGEIGISLPGGGEYQRVAVGTRPTAFALNEENSVVFVANTFSDSISLVDLTGLAVLDEISLGPQPELNLVERGELLFHDARLSSDGWFSCHSCHTDGHSNGLLNDNFGDGSTGAPKRVLSLLGVADSGPWAWNGQVPVLAEQVRKSILTTMRGPEPSEADIEALVAYLHELKPPLALSLARGTVDHALRDRGQDVFDRSGCAECHNGPTFTSDTVYDVGLEDQTGNADFNPPSLRGVSQRNRFFHDNRAENLPAVFESFQHQLDEPLSSADLEALLAYLQTL